jgi:hypothetical protein
MTDTNTGAEAKAPVPGSPEYDTAMAAKFRDSASVVDSGLLAAFGDPADPAAPAVVAAAAEGKPARPENVPEKFWDAATGTVRTDELLKSYTELEKGKPVAAAAAPVVPDPNAPAAEVTNAVKAAGLDLATLGQKIASGGNIDEADYAALEKIGFDRSVVEGIVAGQAVANAAGLQAAYTYAGGEQATNDLMAWAGTSLPDDQKAAYNQMLEGPNWKVALDTLKALKASANPSAGEPSLAAVVPIGGGASTVGYQTEAEMHLAMRDPRYFKQDPVGEAFRRDVQQKVLHAAYRRQAGR